MEKKFWAGQNVLITGFAGFLGFNLTRRLISYGAHVSGLDIKIRRNHTFTKDDYKKITTIRGNVLNRKLLEDIILQYKPKTVFHLAAEAIVGKCNKNPTRTFKTNIEGTWNVLEACRNNSTVKAVVIASSDKAYGSHKILPYKENATLSGSYPYDVSKSCADLIAHAYHHTYKLPVAITRCANLFGPGDLNFSRIVPDAIRCALLDKTLIIRSDGKFTRDYLYVEDAVNGYVLLAEKLMRLELGGEAFNFSEEKPITVLELVHKISRVLNKKPDYKVLNIAKYEIKNQYLSSTKARQILNWKPKYTLAGALKETIAWYKNYYNRYED